GHKAVSADADAIVRAAIRAEPTRLVLATLDNTFEQLTRFASGDGIELWPSEVGSWIDTDFPAWESATFHDALQQNAALLVPAPLASIHRFTAIAGILAALLLLPIAAR